MTIQGETSNRHSLVGARRLERLLRTLHQCRAQRHRSDRPLSWRDQTARRHCLRPNSAGLGHRSADRQSVLRLSRLQARQGREPKRRDGDALRPQRAAHVHRRLRHHASRLSEDQGRDAGVAGRARLGVHHRRDRPDRRLRRTDDSPIDAARRDARHAGGNFDRLHLHAARISDVGGAVDRFRFAGYRVDGMDR